MTEARFIMIKVFSAAICANLVNMLYLWHKIDIKIAIFALPAAFIAGYIVPNVWTDHLMEERQKKIRRELPDMLDMLVISVEAGLGFDQAVAKIVGATKGPLAQEFGRALQEIQAGTDRATALRNLEERAEVPELNAFIMAMVQADVFGISVSNVLTTQAQEIRLRRRQHAEEVAQKAPVKIVFPVVVCILPASLLVVAGPAVIAIGQAFGMMGK
jgi:tight adherence protein C